MIEGVQELIKIEEGLIVKKKYIYQKNTNNDL